MSQIPVALSWSGGKDSTLALCELRASRAYDVRVLLTTVTQGYERISMHGVRRVLLERQAASLGLPLEVVPIPPSCSNEEYERSFGAALEKSREHGIPTFAAGDLFLDDVRAYREAFAQRHGMSTLFPLWGRDTKQLAHEFIEAGFKAILTCVDTHALSADFVGCDYDLLYCATCPTILTHAARMVSSTLSSGMARDLRFRSVVYRVKSSCAKSASPIATCSHEPPRHRDTEKI